ncbi:hypothetical protein [Microcoleus asticus]|uniref:hypothetical protein n=1 Tax=Microcoleus asticus TaxID=2815231 RepID=UPI0015576ECA|nr:hypothetical protein [Microcoleus asticus]
MLLYLCGWLCGDSPGDGVGPRKLRQKLLQFLKKATVKSLTGCGTPTIDCFTHLYFFRRQGDRAGVANCDRNCDLYESQL